MFRFAIRHALIACALINLQCRAFALEEPDHEVPLPWGAAAERAHCPDTSSFAWVTHPEGSDCIRYFAAGDLEKAPIVVAIFSGDRDRLLKYRSDEIPGNTRRSREAIAAKFSRQSGLPVVLVSRPGIYGSSGNHLKRRQAREYRALDAALSSLKKRYGIGQFALLGHSGGATAAAGILTLGREDILCAVLSSGAFDLDERARRRAAATGRSEAENRDTTGVNAPFDPLHHVEGIAFSPSRRIYVLGNAADQVTPFDLQKKFADVVAKAGHHVELRDIPASPPRFHDLLGGVGLKTIQACIQAAQGPTAPAEERF
ncbi:hypothetical protein [Thauera sp.]|jgi:pimeloyl-ACP methyl ester carboxylesterase|uniref:alpha/beta hydrolase family protein n=1 Tax=Thauera sp. TaxID=1905334 RepID=UPI002A3693EE|nr:hypothetical protein [Thauera sp.]MDX9886569.1 hypothetical protein [Thauera sp.]